MSKFFNDLFLHIRLYEVECYRQGFAPCIMCYVLIRSHILFLVLASTYSATITNVLCRSRTYSTGVTGVQ